MQDAGPKAVDDSDRESDSDAEAGPAACDFVRARLPTIERAVAVLAAAQDLPAECIVCHENDAAAAATWRRWLAGHDEEFGEGTYPAIEMRVLIAPRSCLPAGLVEALGRWRDLGRRPVVALIGERVVVVPTVAEAAGAA
jgi:hypothetical protein